MVTNLNLLKSYTNNLLFKNSYVSLEHIHFVLHFTTLILKDFFQNTTKTG